MTSVIFRDFGLGEEASLNLQVFDVVQRSNRLFEKRSITDNREFQSKVPLLS